MAEEFGRILLILNTKKPPKQIHFCSGLQLYQSINIISLLYGDGTPPQLVNESKNYLCCIQLETETEPNTATVKILRFPERNIHLLFGTFVKFILNVERNV